MMLIDCKGDVNASDNDGNRPVHLAALNGHEEVCLFGVNLQKNLWLLHTLVKMKIGRASCRERV